MFNLNEITMNENIDLTKILKDCPKGFPLYSTIYGGVIFSRIINNTIQFIYIYNTSYGSFRNIGCVNSEGNPSTSYNGECTLFPSKDQRDWSKFTAPWLKKEKFDPNILQPFDKVLVRDDEDYNWKADFYYVKYAEEKFPYACVGSHYKYCIPYNNCTKYLIGTNKKAPEYYRYWED